MTDEEALEALEKIKDIVKPFVGEERRCLEERTGAAEANARRMSQYAETVKHECDAIEKKANQEIERLKVMIQAQAEQLAARPLRLCEVCPKEGGEVAGAADHYLCNDHAEALAGAVNEAWQALKAAGCDDGCRRTHGIHHAIQTLMAERDDARRIVDALTATIRQGGPLSAERYQELQSELLYGDWRAEKATKSLKEDLEKCREQLCAVEDELRAARQPPSPVPLILNCPVCHARHIDRGDFATKVHHTHSCQNCGVTWRPAVVATVGVEFLPGFRDAT